MTEPATTPTPTEPTTTAPAQDDGGDLYTPTFSKEVRTYIYIIAAILTVIGVGVWKFMNQDLGEYIIMVAAFTSQVFAVTYNPMRMDGKK